MGLIQIEDMEFFSYHGCFKEEQIIGNKFIVNIDIETDTKKAELSDDINDALNYQRVYEYIKEEMKTTSHLLEHVCKRIIDVLYKNFSGIEKISVKVSKMNPPMGGQINKVSLRIER